jgi:hypothetical protein
VVPSCAAGIATAPPIMAALKIAAAAKIDFNFVIPTLRDCRVIAPVGNVKRVRGFPARMRQSVRQASNNERRRGRRARA